MALRLICQLNSSPLGKYLVNEITFTHALDCLLVRNDDGLWIVLPHSRQTCVYYHIADEVPILKIKMKVSETETQRTHVITRSFDKHFCKHSTYALHELQVDWKPPNDIRDAHFCLERE